MADQRDGGISWTDETWSPITGCSHASPGCKNCYAETMAKRLHAMGQTHAYTTLPWTAQNAAENVKTHPDRLEIPLRWKRSRKIFVCSMADLFHDRVPFEFIAAVFGVMSAAPQHVFQVLTKRSDRLVEFYQWLEERGQRVSKLFPNDPQDWRIRQQLHAAVLRAGANPFLNSKGGHGDIWPLPNVWVGVSVEDQRRADERIPHLLKIPAAVRWLSVEPLLGPVTLWDRSEGCWRGPGIVLSGGTTGNTPDGPGEGYDDSYPGIDQVIVGGESGPNARPMHPAWARSLRDQCVEVGVAFHFKQHGEWMPTFHGIDPNDGDPNCRIRAVHTFPDGQHMWRVGKKAAGRLLDGRTWDEFPASVAQAVPA